MGAEPVEQMERAYLRIGKPDFMINGGFFDMSNGKTASNLIDDGVTKGKTCSNFGLIVDGDSIRFGDITDAKVDFIGGTPALLKNGKIDIDQSYGDSFNLARHPRSAIGDNADNLYLVTVDGRRQKEAPGMTLPELAEFMLSLGCVNAINLDGGGSTRLLHNGDAINSPTENRKVDNFICVWMKEETKIMGKKLIALDDGHGMETAGKRTPAISELSGKVIHENEFNRAVVKFLDEDLKRCGFDTLLVAPTDDDTSLSARTTLANTKGADLYISIHYNALDGKFDGNDPEGHSVHIYPGSKEGRKLAEYVLKYLKEGTSQKNRGIVESNFHVLRETKMPAILSENGFMDNKREAMLMISETFQKEVAQEHAKGICEYFGVKWVEPTTTPANTKVMFSDMIVGDEPHYANDYVNSLAEKGIVSGYPDGTFHPAEYISRADVCVIVAKTIESIEKKFGK